MKSLPYVRFGDQWKAEAMKMRKADLIDLLKTSLLESQSLAKLAAQTPQFFNPLDAMQAELVRDRILSTL